MKTEKTTTALAVSTTQVATAGLADIVTGDAWKRIQEVGIALMKSGMLGEITEAGGVAAALVMAKQGLDPVEFSQRYHIIKNRPSVKPGYALGLFQCMGGRYTIVRSDDDVCEMRFTFGDIKDFPVKVEIEKILKTTIPYGANGKIKDNWQNFTDDMLFARCVAKGLRRVAPSVIGGMYLDAEVQDFKDEPKQDAPKEIARDDVRFLVKPQERAAPAPEPQPEPAKPAEPVVVEAEIVEAATEEPADQNAQESVPDSNASDEFLRCPVEGPYHGKLFTEMEADILQYLLSPDTLSRRKEMTENHIANAKAALEGKVA